MVYVHSLSDNEKKELSQMTRKQVGRVAERARMILLSGIVWISCIRFLR